MDEITIRVINGLDWERSGFIVIDLENSLHSQAIQLYSELNEEVTAQFYFLPNNRVQIKFAVEHIPARDNKCYYLRIRDPHAPFAFPTEGLLDGNNYYLENDVVRIVTEFAGTLTLMEKRPVPEDPTRLKVTAMGEELSEGSIWAGERFLSYPLLFQVQINHQIAQIQHVQSVLQEANDYSGQLHLSLTYQTASIKDVTIEARIGLIKGNNPTVRMHVDCTYTAGAIVQFVFPVLPVIVSPKVYSDETLVALWDPGTTRGLVFLLKSIHWEIPASNTNASQKELLLTLPSIKYTSQNERTHQSIDFTFLPLGGWDESVNPPIKPSVMRWIHEYFSPLQWNVEQ